MHSLTSTLTASVLLLHALVGCGWHAADACHRCHASQATAWHAADCCGHEHDASVPNRPASLPCECHFQCHRTCISLPPQKIDVGDSHQALVVAFALADVPALGPQLVAASHCSPAGRRAHAEPPLGLHLLHQSLLI